METTNLSDIHLSILVKMLANLPLKDLTSIRATNTHLRDMMTKPVFWEMYYRSIFGKALNKPFTWKDLKDLDSKIHDIDTIASSQHIDEFIDKFKKTNSQLIEVYVRLKGVDRLNPNVDSSKYLQNYIRVYIYIHRPDLLLIEMEKANYVEKKLADIVVYTPSRYLFQRIIQKINWNIKVQERTFSIYVHFFIEYIFYNIFAHLTLATVKQTIVTWSNWMRIMGLDKYLSDYIYIDEAMEYLENYELDDYVMKLAKEFLEQFLY